MAKMSIAAMRANSKCSEFLISLGIAGHGGLRWDPTREGYCDFTFGCRAGPGKANIMDLCHELAHAAQFGPELYRYRAREDGFKFKIPHVWVADTWCEEAKTAQATLRELDTFAHQAHLLEASGMQFSRSEMFTYAGEILVRWMHDWYQIPGDNEAGRRQWCSDQAEVLYRKRSQSEVLDRLKGWLDKTEARFKRLSRAAA